MTPLSDEARAARAPLPPADLVDALQDNIHVERGRLLSSTPILLSDDTNGYKRAYIVVQPSEPINRVTIDIINGILEREDNMMREMFASRFCADEENK